MIEIDSHTSDAELLRQFVEFRSPEAFAELAGRYLPLIYSSAIRQVRDGELAEDLAQATLIILARKAGQIDPSLLAGWLIKTTHYTSRNALRERARRRVHEQGAAAMRKESDVAQIQADREAVSREIDSALAGLREIDRAAVALRFFQNKSFAEIAVQLQTTESAAQRRIARAVDKLRKMLVARGASVAPGALPVLLAEQVLHPVPESLLRSAKSISSIKSGSASLIAKGALYTMATAKIKVAAAVVAAVLLLGVAAPAVYHFGSRSDDVVIPISARVTGVDLSKSVTGALPAGMSVEQMGIMNLSDRQWRTLSGAPLEMIPNGIDRIISNLRVTGATHAFLFRVASPDSSVDWSYSLRGTSAYASTGQSDPKTKLFYGVAVFAPKPGASSITFSVEAATGDWTNRAVIPAITQSSIAMKFGGASFVFDPPIQEKNRVRVIRHGVDSTSGVCMTLYALDVAGKRVDPSGMSSDGRNQTYDFSGALSKYKEFRFDTRPYNYKASFAPVPLSQGK